MSLADREGEGGIFVPGWGVWGEGPTCLGVNLDAIALSQIQVLLLTEQR